MSNTAKTIREIIEDVVRVHTTNPVELKTPLLTAFKAS